MKLRLWLGAVVLVVLGCSPDTDGSSGPSTAACGHFDNVLADIRDGVLSDSEIRGKLQEVESGARGGPVADEARALLSAYTQNDAAGVERSSYALQAACDQ